MKASEVIISGAVVFKKAENGRTYWFLVKDSENGDWEVPKVIARRGESSVRAAMRLMAEKGGMNTKVIEEAGRFGSSTALNGKVVPKRHLFYLMRLKAAGEVLGFDGYEWVQYQTAVKRIKSKKEMGVFKNAGKELENWRERLKAKRKKK